MSRLKLMVVIPRIANKRRGVLKKSLRFFFVLSVLNIISFNVRRHRKLPIYIFLGEFILDDSEQLVGGPIPVQPDQLHGDRFAFIEADLGRCNVQAEIRFAGLD